MLRRMIWGAGRGLRETGQAIERMGARAQVFRPRHRKTPIAAGHRSALCSRLSGCLPLYLSRNGS